ncbi:DUF1499 domain-containing protein [Desulforhopalus vacuolatus]|uniref:DUF1499 domain-containing protein n=1 Tax=Desulforhopalus vacuolatus TaxID=40414 RepID=UPI001965362E|nr:DUF1499 domain-containing protein [Desulforhopalus vacuolatus]MBM9519964.1 DUF1499 domain-containing protein [Desulforhopalus vacuolatus]
MKKKIQLVLSILILLTGCTKVIPELGVENGQLAQCSTKPNCVSSQTKDKKHYIEPLLLTGTPSEVKNNILKILTDFQVSKIVVAESNYIRAEFTSKVFHFVDDVEFYFPDTKSEEITIHVRSASRVGYSDFGVNRKRIEQLRRKLRVINPDVKSRSDLTE